MATSSEPKLSKPASKTGNQSFPFLRSFVKPEDFEKFLGFFHGVKKGTLKKRVSVVVVEGPASSGKRTVWKIVHRISPPYDTVRHSHLFAQVEIRSDGVGSSALDSLRSEYIYTYSLSDDYVHFAISANRLHELANTGVCFRRKTPRQFKKPLELCFLNQPGVVVIATRIPLVIETGKELQWNDVA